jgi:FMN phosphatase YigB (HAD superfamily)
MTNVSSSISFTPTCAPGQRTKPKAIIFDIGSVIVRVTPERALTPLSAIFRRVPDKIAPISSSQLWAAIQADPQWPGWQEGRVTPQEWHEHLTRELAVPIGFSEFCTVWNNVLEPETILPEKLFERLGSSCRLALLSNTDPIHAAHLENNFPFVSQFPTRVYSCSVGIRKPSAQIFEKVLTLLDTAPGDALYIDDIEEFVVSARHAGLDAIRFDSAAQLYRDFVLRGLLDQF